MPEYRKNPGAISKLSPEQSGDAEVSPAGAFWQAKP